MKIKAKKREREMKIIRTSSHVCVIYLFIYDLIR